MAVKRVSPEEARDLMGGQGYVYIDVRSVPEFEAGHPEGAYNIPLMNMGLAGMTPNPDFLAVVEKSFPRDARLVVGCKAGGRSAKAAAILEQAGFTDVVDQRNGFDGTPLPTGGVEPGWRPRGLPTSENAPADRTYAGLKGASGR
ncbi:MAG TPA: rhodanese-like domain-containing protein [Vicinamibacteria bacterium]|nr:rhodanese-like domain-containing protein [Vicinamibacteria bacterium]